VHVCPMNSYRYLKRSLRCGNDIRHSRTTTNPRVLNKQTSPRFIDQYLAPTCTTRQFSSVSASEVSKFSQFSKTWWDPRENPLIGMNSIRVEYIKDQILLSSDKGLPLVDYPLSGLTALDVGCGGGLLSESLARLGASVTAIDPSVELVEQAQHHSQLDPRTRSIDYRGGWSVERLAEESNTKYDVICILEVIEHVADVDSVFSSISSLLQPKGKLFLSTLNRTAKSKALAVVGAEYVMRYLPVGTHDWSQFRSPEEVESLMETTGLEEMDVTGMVLTSPPLWGQWNWQLDPKDTDINWIGTYQLKSSS
jgi:2-polyprenyl-6-hydroxyphenyl methylase/3-demethylubiquinone-9 3-methyltransferase